MIYKPSCIVTFREWEQNGNIYKVQFCGDFMGSETLREKRKQPELMGISFSFNAKEELYRCLDDLRFRSKE